MATKQFLVTKMNAVAGNERTVTCYELLEPQKLRVWRGKRGTSAVCKDKVFGLDMIEKFEAGVIQS